MSTSLPTGTHVVVDGRAARVAGSVGADVRVRFAGGEERLVSAASLTASRLGEAAFAARREAAWGALLPTVVLDTVVGSRAWGLADAQSDTDRRGLFALPTALRLGLVAPPEDLVSLDGSETYWELGKGIRQALRSDPNTLEALFVPGATARDPIGAWILEAREIFPSRAIARTFGRYDHSQLTKLLGAARVHGLKGALIAWAKGGSLTAAAAAARIEERGERDGRARLREVLRSLADRALLPDASFETFLAAARAGALDDAAQGRAPSPLRPKNAYNLLRLLHTGERWLATGAPQFVFGGAIAERLWAVKRGEVPLEDLVAEAEALAVRVDEALRHSPLPEGPDVARADALYRRCQEELVRRFVAGGPGPFGADAPLALVAPLADDAPP